MGRRRSLHHDLPPGVQRKGVRLYYGRTWTPLGREDDPAWLRKYADLHGTVIGSTTPTFADATRHYRLHELPKKRPKTQREYTRQLKVLDKVYGPMPLTTIHPADIHRLVEKMTAKHSATRLKALFSAVFNVARNADLTTAPNPCIGVRGVKSSRDVNVLDAQLVAVLKQAERPLRDFLELAYRTGADASVVLRLTRQDVRDGALHVQRTKTGKRVAIAVEGPLEAILKRREGVASLYLVADDKGQPFTLQTMRKRFWVAREKAGVTFQIRDLRAKAGTDVGTIEDARRLLGHASETTTALYRRRKVGERARPVMREIDDGTK
jgi:integrase